MYHLWNVKKKRKLQKVLYKYFKLFLIMINENVYTLTNKILYYKSYINITLQIFLKQRKVLQIKKKKFGQEYYRILGFALPHQFRVILQI